MSRSVIAIMLHNLLRMQLRYFAHKSFLIKCFIIVTIPYMPTSISLLIDMHNSEKIQQLKLCITEKKMSIAITNN